MSYIDLGQADPAAPGEKGLLVFKNRPTTAFFGEIGPRFGAAYQLNNKIVVRMGYAMMNTPPIANNWGFGGFTTGYSGNVNVTAGTSPTGFSQDPSMYLTQAFPSLRIPTAGHQPGRWPFQRRPDRCSRWQPSGLRAELQLHGAVSSAQADGRRRGLRRQPWHARVGVQPIQCVARD